MSTKRRSLQDTQNHAVSLDKTTMNQHKAANKISPLSTAASTSKAAAKNTGGRGLSRQQQGTDDAANEYGLDDANISDDEEGGTRIGDIYIPPPVPPHCSTESKGPRLMIKKIENNNFKSYAGKVVLGPFHHCFTAIIGPNGSGKSNVIDSMLFVFGYRANKIRCKKISTLLHNSAKYPNMAMCSVAVHFRQIIDKEDGSCEEVPNSEIIVERTAYRDNSSFYTINGRRVQFKEVAKLLKQHSVDLDHNRFLILQGEVESIAMMKAKGQTENECGMLEYLEDIVGTTRYKAPLVKISDRVERLTEERTEKHNRCKLAEREMKDLEQPYNEALEYLRKENENTRTKNLRIQKYLSEKNKKLEEYTKEHTEVTNELKEHDEVEEALRKEREQKELQIKEEMAWLLGKQLDDEAEGLWRIYDLLYDFTDFIEYHPGGSFWLKETRGTDITEAFETHHISLMPEQILHKYRVRQATQARNYTLTMHEHGFYKTLKKRVREKLKTIDHRPRQRTLLMHFSLLLATFVFTIASAVTGSAFFEVLAALALCWLAIAAHNFFHRRDNWQMYSFNLTLMNFHAWRISHALSHHAYANSLHDLEMSMFEPFLCWVPSVHYGTKLRRFTLLLGQPVIYAAIFPAQFITRLLQSLLQSNVLFWHDIIGFLLPALMLTVAGDATILGVLRQWFFILGISGFLFGFIGLSAAHHHPQIYHDGDAQRTDRDWGLFQMDTIIDRGDIKGSPFMVLTHFGEHALHHLFPTLDHGLLPQLYPEFRQTLQEFDIELRECNHLKHIIGQNKQLLRTARNSNPPGNIKND